MDEASPRIHTYGFNKDRLINGFEVLKGVTI